MKRFYGTMLLSFALLLPGGAHAADCNAPATRLQEPAEAVAAAADFSIPLTGRSTLYHQGRNDISGVAVGDTWAVYFDDGGKPSDFPFVRVFPSAEISGTVPDRNGKNVPLAVEAKDLEGGTFLKGQFYGTTSAGKLVRFSVDPSGASLSGVGSVELGDAIREAFGDPNAKLNIEGLSATADPMSNTIVFGLRSPLSGEDAVLAFVTDPFGTNPSVTIETAFLPYEEPERGIRGIEYIPALESYVIIGGPVPKADGYALYTWKPGQAAAQRIDVPGFDQLCRPESVVQGVSNGAPVLIVASEESGAACASVPFTVVRSAIE